jgi:hypothetical protein
MIRRLASFSVALLIGFLAAIAARAFLASAPPPASPRGIPAVRRASGERAAARPVAAARPPATAPEEGVPEAARGPASFQAVDAATGAAVPPRRVSLVSEEGASDLELSGSSFALDLGAAPDALLEVEAAGYLLLSVPLEALPAEGGELHLVKQAALIVRCVSEESLEPVAGVHVAVVCRGAPTPPATTDALGVARLNDYPLCAGGRAAGGAEEHTLEVAAAAAGWLPKRVQVPVSPASAWSQVELRLLPAVELDILVIDATRRSPVAGAGVVHQWGYGNRGRINDDVRVRATGEDGRVRLPVRRGARRIEVVAVHPEFATRGTAAAEVSDLPAGPSGPELVLELEPGFTVEGVVLDEEGNPVQGVMVDLDPIERDDFTDWMRFAAYSFLSHLPDMAPTGEDGAFQLDRVAAGTYRVVLGHAGYHQHPGNPLLEVPRDAAGWLGIVERGLTLSGIVVDQRGMGIADVKVSLYREDESGRAVKGYAKVLRTDLDGAFTARGLVPEVYQAVFLGTRRHATAILSVDAAAPPRPWRLVLEERLAPVGDGSGALWLRLSREGLLLSEVEAEVSLYRGNASAPERTFRARVHGGEVYRDGVPSGEYEAVIRFESYAPAVIPRLAVAESPVEPLAVEVSVGAAAVFELEGPREPGAIEVLEGRRGRVLARLPAPALDGGVRRLAARLEPGEYAARFKGNAGSTGRLSFVVAPGGGGAAEPCLRLPARPSGLEGTGGH